MATDSISFSPDGRLLAAANNYAVELWDPATGQLLRRVYGEWETRPIICVAFSPDGSILAEGSLDGVVTLLSTANWEPMGKLYGHSGPVVSVAFSPDGRSLAGGSQDGTISLWDLATSELVRSFETDAVGPDTSMPGCPVAFSPDGALLATASPNHAVQIWNIVTGALQQTLAEHIDTVTSIAFSPDGKTVAAGAHDGAVLVWDLGSSTRKRLLNHYSWVDAIAFSPDGSLLAAGGVGTFSTSRGHNTGQVKLWDVRTGKRLLSTSEEHRNMVWAVAFSPNGTLLASADYRGTIVLSDVSALLPTEQQTIDQITAMIARHDLSWQAGPTDVSGLKTSLEARQLTGAEPSPQTAFFPTRMVNPLVFTPRHFDWRDKDGYDWTAPIRDQGRCSSCVSHAALAVLESVAEIAKDDPHLRLDLSEQCLFSCGCGKGCNTGWSLQGALVWLLQHGVPNESVLPYVPVTTPCSSGCYTDSSMIKLSIARRLTSREAIKQSLVENGPVLTRMWVYSDFMYYKSGVYRRPDADPFIDGIFGLYGGHAVAVVGFDDGGDSKGGCWIVRNSWGTSWGENGYCRIGYGEVGIEDEAYEVRYFASGDISVRLSWRSGADLDLHVWDPAGSHIYYGNGSLPAGAHWEHDANRMCLNQVADPDESVYWDPGTALHGTYTVKVYCYDECGQAMPQGFKLAVVAGDVPVHEISETLEGYGSIYTYEFDW
ncbi:MAG: C1 family peptidase [Thermotogota bacterium]